MKQVVSLALTWDGTRWPVKSLPPKARTFLGGKAAPGTAALGKLLADDRVKEIRICWVPWLKGGDAVLSEPFLAPAGKRIAFAAAKKVRFGDLLGVVYRRRN